MNFRMTSYADNFEDVVLQRAFDLESKGFYIDVGAYNPVEHSVTKQFYDRGWRGINIEPNPKPFGVLVAERDRDVNLNIGLSNRRGELTLFDAPGACWSVDRDMVTGYFGAAPADVVERSIPIRTLAEVCDEHVPAGTTVDFLKIDVEGHEREVIEGGDWTRHRPRIVLAESNGYESWEPVLIEAGYHFTLFEGVNRFYVRDEDARLIPRRSLPANGGDRFLIYGYLRRIHELETSVREQSLELDAIRGADRQTYELLRQCGPTARKVVRHLGHAAKRYPLASRLAKKVVQRLGRRA